MWSSSISMWWPLSLGILLGVAGGFLLSQWRSHSTQPNSHDNGAAPGPGMPYQGVERRVNSRAIKTQDGRI